MFLLYCRCSLLLSGSDKVSCLRLQENGIEVVQHFKPLLSFKEYRPRLSKIDNRLDEHPETSKIRYSDSQKNINPDA